MLNPTTLLRFLPALLLAASGSASANAARDKPANYPAELRFEARMSDKLIGTQNFLFEQISGQKLKVNITANFVVPVLGLYPYRYSHANEEIWENRCLVSLNSSTQSGGSHQRVEGRATQQGFTVQRTDKTPRLLGSCVSSFPYWDKSLLLGRSFLLNSQTGKYLPVSVKQEGAGSIELFGKIYSTEKIRIQSGDELDILLHYKGEHWVALDSPTWNGKVLQLRRLTPLTF